MLIQFVCNTTILYLPRIYGLRLTDGKGQPLTERLAQYGLLKKFSSVYIWSATRSRFKLTFFKSPYVCVVSKGKFFQIPIPLALRLQIPASLTEDAITK